MLFSFAILGEKKIQWRLLIVNFPNRRDLSNTTQMRYQKPRESFRFRVSIYVFAKRRTNKWLTDDIINAQAVQPLLL